MVGPKNGRTPRRFQLSARAYDRVRRVPRTIEDHNRNDRRAAGPCEASDSVSTIIERVASLGERDFQVPVPYKLFTRPHVVLSARTPDSATRTLAEPISSGTPLLAPSIDETRSRMIA